MGNGLSSVFNRVTSFLEAFNIAIFKSVAFNKKIDDVSGILSKLADLFYWHIK